MFFLLDVFFLLKRLLLLFGGETPVNGDPWYHEKFSKEAADDAGWNEGASKSLAWHADYVDSYLYNPVWWVQGGLDRAKVVLAIHDDLVKLHFDDLASTAEVRAMWARYLTGTVAGLLWAAEQGRTGDVAAARNVVGASLHAIQDFYSHSNWVDAADRRERTWFEMGPMDPGDVQDLLDSVNADIPDIPLPKALQDPPWLEELREKDLRSRHPDGPSPIPSKPGRIRVSPVALNVRAAKFATEAGSQKETEDSSSVPAALPDAPDLGAGVADEQPPESTSTEADASETLRAEPQLIGRLTIELPERLPKKGLPKVDEPVAPTEEASVRRLDLDPRDSMTLYTGTYELPESAGIKPHGKFAFDCSVIRQLGGGPVMDAICGLTTPFTEGGICDRWRDCQEQGVETGPDSVLDVRLPEGVLTVHPLGIALDNRWLADIAVQQRDVDDETLTGSDLFETASNLAKRSSAKWLETLAELMGDAGHAGFWQRVTTQPRDAQADEAQFETPWLFPFQFLTAGAYPSMRGDDDWYVRIELTTADDESFCGTDADIVAELGERTRHGTIAGEEFLLDYMPYDSRPIVSWNDFESGNKAVYTVGPLPTCPTHVRLHNRAAGVGDALQAAADALVEAVENAVEAIGHFLLSVIGGHADRVGQTKRVWSWADLLAIAQKARRRRTGTESFTMIVDGREEGNYRLTGSISVTPQAGGAEVVVRFDRLDCRKESTWDRGTTEDEPFVLAVLHNFAAQERIEFPVFGPYSGVDTGDSRAIGQEVSVFVPTHGVLALPVVVFESDDESSSARQDLLNQFAIGFNDQVEEKKEGFLDVLGRAVAADWKLDHIRVFTFRRNQTVEAGSVLDEPVQAWVEGDSHQTFHLTHDALRQVELPSL